MNVLPDVYVCPLRKSAPFLPEGGSKMHTSRSKANSQRVLTEINESAAIAKIRISLEKDTTKRLKAFRIISSKMPISVILC